MEDKALEMGQTSATGSFHLFIGKSVSTVVLAVGTIILGLFILQSDSGSIEAESLFNKFEFLLKQIRGLQRINALEVTPPFKKARTP